MGLNETKEREKKNNKWRYNKLPTNPISLKHNWQGEREMVKFNCSPTKSDILSVKVVKYCDIYAIFSSHSTNKIFDIIYVLWFWERDYTGSVNLAFRFCYYLKYEIINFWPTEDLPVQQIEIIFINIRYHMKRVIWNVNRSSRKLLSSVPQTFF